MMRRSSSRGALGLLAGCLVATGAQAAPTGGTVSGVSNGRVVISAAGATTTVDSTAHRAVVDWTGFTVNPGEAVNFLLPDKNAILVNRARTAQIDINGAINSYYGPNGGSVGGSVWFLSPAGVFFGRNAVVNVGGILATTADLTNQAGFLAAADTDPIAFSGGPINGDVSIDAGAQIVVNDGSAIFASDNVVTNGSVVGKGAFPNDTKVLFGGARAFTIRFSANPPDPLRASDLALFDFSIDTPGFDVIQQAPAVTSAGQVIFAEIGDPTRLQAGSDAALQVSGGSVTATGRRGDGYDLILAGENIVGGAPAGQPFTSRVGVTITRPTPQSPQATLTSAGGLYVSGDSVFIGRIGDQGAIFSVNGLSEVNGNVVALTEVADQITPYIDAEERLTFSPTIPQTITISDRLGDTHLGSVYTSGSVTINSAGNFTSGAIHADGQLSITAGGALTLPNSVVGSLIANAKGDLTVSGAVYLDTGGSLTSGGVFHNTAPIFVESATSPALPSPGAVQPVLTISATNVDIRAPIIVYDASGNSAAIFLTTPNPAGSAIGDNLAAPGSAYALSSAELALLSADDLTVVQQGAGRLRFGDLTVNPAKLHEIGFQVIPALLPTGIVAPQAAAPLATATIEGTVQATGAEPFVLGGAGLGQIVVSGSLGTAAAPFSSISLSAQNIYFGSQAFIAQDQAGAYPAGYTFIPGQGGIAVGHTYVAGGFLALNAPGVIAEQSTSQTGAGLAVGSLAISGPPTRVDLYGTVRDGQGVVVGGSAAALSPRITVPAGPAAAGYRFNSCVIGQAGRCSNQTTALLSVVRPQDLAGRTSDQPTAPPPAIDQFQDFQKKRRRTEIFSGLANEDFWPVGTP